jgi:hypothetical protein
MARQDVVSYLGRLRRPFSLGASDRHFMAWACGAEIDLQAF